MHALLLAAALAAAPDASPAQSPEDRAKLEADIARELGAAPPSSPPATSSPGPSAAPPAATSPGPSGAPAQPAAPETGTTGANPYARLLLVPDISAIGSANLSYVSPVTAARSPRDAPFGSPGRVRAVFDELELGLQAVVDPYARADAFIGFGSEGVGIEEAYVTWLRLPAALLARGGELFAPFGRVNQQHPHTWEFADRPLPLQRLLAADALSGAGADLSWLAPVSWFSELRAAYQNVQPASGEGTRPAGFARALQVFDVGEVTTVSAGASLAVTDEEPGRRDLGGVDLYVKRRLATTGAYFAIQGEALARRLAGVPAAAGGWAWGAYGQAVLRPDRRTGYGVRVERAPGVERGADLRASGLLLVDLSEFQRLRFQAAWDRLPGGANGFESIAALEFSIGAHGAHPF